MAVIRQVCPLLIISLYRCCTAIVLTPPPPIDKIMCTDLDLCPPPLGIYAHHLLLQIWIYRVYYVMYICLSVNVVQVSVNVVQVRTALASPPIGGGP